MKDHLEEIGSSLIQHGKHNDRIYLMSLSDSDYPTIIGKLESLRKKYTYSKIFAKVPASCFPGFMKEGYRLEAYIPGYYADFRDALFICKYFSTERQEVPAGALNTFYKIFDGEKRTIAPRLAGEYTLGITGKKDIDDMTRLYRKVFRSYPFPIHESSYLLKTMQEHVVYFGVWYKKILAGLASSEIDRKNRCAEMTDFAVDPDHRGNNLALVLLREMELEMKKREIPTLFTIARLNSMGMNKTFYNARYCYSGTLVNNTNISGALESMNVWYKHV